MIHDVQVNSEQCRGCGGCETTCSGIFRLTYKVHAEVRGKNFEKHRKQMLAAYYDCPVQAIELSTDDPSLLVAWHAARMIDKTNLSETTLQVRLQTKLSGFKPGQYITVRFKDSVGTFNRAYSVVELREGMLTLCVTLVDGGRGSAFFENQAVGSELEVTDPKGEFILSETKSPKVFVGTGAGLAPLLSMMEACPDVPKTLYFGQRNERELFYLDRLKKIPNLDVNICLDFSDDDWTGLRGRVTKFVRDAPLEKETEVYTCGSDAMMNDLEKVLKKKRHPKNLFFKESFSDAEGITMDESALLRRVWIRNIHIYTSLLFCMLFLFFGFSGFLAGRPELFHADDAQQTLPANIAIEEGELGGFLKAQFGAGFATTGFDSNDGFALITLQNPEHVSIEVDVNESDRSYVVTQSHPLPDGTDGMPPEALAARLAKQFKGRLDEDSIEADGDLVYFNMESVWIKSAITLDREAKRYEVSSETIPWVKAFILIHKGKESAPLQKLLMDAIAWSMVAATLTGMAMVFQSRNPRTKIAAGVLIGASVAILLLLMTNR